jgi:ATP-dependent Clp protease ATP-binding subunit ClpA
MYERFTDDARRAMQAANQEAMRLGHEYIGVEHTLLGILAQPGIVADSVRALGVDSAKVSESVRRVIDPTDTRTRCISAKAVIEEAIADSRKRGHETIGTDHVMLAILRAYTPSLKAAMEGAGLTAQEMRHELLRRNPLRTSPPAPTLETLVQRFLDHPEVVALNQKVISLQQQKEEAVAGQDFELAVRLRDEQEQVKHALAALIARLQSESQSPPSDRHDDD